MLIKKPRKWKYELLIAEIVAIVMMFFLGVTLVSAQTIFETSSYEDALDDLAPFTVGANFGAPWQGDYVASTSINYAPIATGTITNFIIPFRWIPFGGFDGSQTVQVQLERQQGGTTDYRDCYTDPFVPDQLASSGVPTLVNFSVSGTECDVYDDVRDDPPNYVTGGDEWQYRFVGNPGHSGAYGFAYRPDGGQAWLIYGEDGPTNPDLAVIEEVVTTPIDFLTRFTNAQAKGNSSSTISIDVDYELNTAEYTANTRPDYITIQVISDGLFSDQQVASANKLILPLADGPHSRNVPIDYHFPDGDYFAYIHFWNINTNAITFEQTGVVISFEVSGGVVQNALVEEITDGLDISTPGIYEDCSISNLDGCFKNALIYVFVPEPDAFDKFTTIYKNIEKKPPFGYVTAVKNALGGITDSATPAFAFGDIPFQTTIFDPFKAILAIGLWVLYALFFMGRINKLDI